MKFKIRREVWVSILSLFVFGLLTGWLTFQYDVRVAKLTGTQWFLIHTLILILRDAPGYYLGKHADRLRDRMGAAHSRMRKIAADTAVLIIYQVPLNVLAAWIMGADGGQLRIVLVIYFLHNLLLGWLFSFIRDIFRWWLLPKQNA